jgi:hypothetical protein
MNKILPEPKTTQPAGWVGCLPPFFCLHGQKRGPEKKLSKKRENTWIIKVTPNLFCFSRKVVKENW